MAPFSSVIVHQARYLAYIGKLILPRKLSFTAFHNTLLSVLTTLSFLSNQDMQRVVYGSHVHSDTVTRPLDSLLVDGTWIEAVVELCRTLGKFQY